MVKFLLFYTEWRTFCLKTVLKYLYQADINIVAHGFL